jgi:hypothetical protein
MAVAPPLRVVLAARPHQLGDLLFENLRHHRQTDAESQQPFPDRLLEGGEPDCDLLRERERRPFLGYVNDAGARYGCHWRFLLGLIAPFRTTWHGGVEDRFSISTNYGTTSGSQSTQEQLKAAAEVAFRASHPIGSPRPGRQPP